VYARNPFLCDLCAIPAAELPFSASPRESDRQSVLYRQQVELPQRVDRLRAPILFEVPERPTVAARRALQRLADAVDRAGLLAAGDRAVGTHGRGPAAPFVEQLSSR